MYESYWVSEYSFSCNSCKAHVHISTHTLSLISCHFFSPRKDPSPSEVGERPLPLAATVNSKSLFVIHLCNWGGWTQGGSRLQDSFAPQCSSVLVNSNSVLMNFLIFKELASPELMDWTQDCMHARKGLNHWAASLTYFLRQGLNVTLCWPLWL